jgi:hypothetical protein
MSAAVVDGGVERRSPSCARDAAIGIRSFSGDGSDERTHAAADHDHDAADHDHDEPGHLQR